MLRTLLTVVLPLIAPFLAWWLYLQFSRHLARRAGEPDPPGWTRAPWTAIIVAGVVLMLASLLLFRVTSGGAPWTEYRAPTVEDGRIVPGRVGAPD